MAKIGKKNAETARNLLKKIGFFYDKKNNIM